MLGVGYWFPDEYTDWAPKFDEAIKKAGAETVLTIVWPDKHDAYTIQEYVAVNDALASQLGARVAPVGVAVDRVMRERPELIQYVDEYHVNAYGWYLDLCVLYATMFERSPEGLAYRMEDIPKFSEEGKLWRLYKLPDGWQISEEDAAYLQQIAWDTVQEYQKP